MFLKQKKVLLRINAIKLFFCPNSQPLTLIIFVSANKSNSQKQNHGK